MFDQTLALMKRTLREDTRLLRASLVRCGVLAFIGWMLLMTHSQAASAGAPGLMLFVVTTNANFFVIALAGMSFFATTITEEKEERTLGLLKMAGVGTPAILLGKSTSRLLVAALLLTLEVPFILLAVTLGGVLIGQIVAAYCTLLVFLLSVANVALLASVISRSSRGASMLMAILLAFFFWLPPIVLGVTGSLAGNSVVDESAASVVLLNRAAEWVRDLSPFSQISRIMTTGFSDPILGQHLVVHLVAAAAAFALAWASFDACTRNDEPIAPPRAMPARRGRSPRRAWTPALVWKDFTFVTGGPTMLIAKGLVYGLAIYLFHLLAELTRSRNSAATEVWESIGLAAFIVGLGSFVIESSLYAGRFLRDEVQGQTLSAVCLLPQSVPRLMYAKLAGCGLGLIPALFWIVVGMQLNPDDTYRPFLHNIEYNPEPMLWAAMFVLFLHLAAYLSLVVKWGASPLAFVLVFIGGHLFWVTVLLVSQSLTGGFLLPNFMVASLTVSVCHLIPVPFLHVAAIKRLRRLASG